MLRWFNRRKERKDRIDNYRLRFREMRVRLHDLQHENEYLKNSMDEIVKGETEILEAELTLLKSIVERKNLIIMELLKDSENAK